MKTFRQAQSILEYAVLFAVVLAALIGSMFIGDTNRVFQGHLVDMAEEMAGDSFEASTIGDWN